ncbi:DUF3014 domain-containing protein [uncultured Oxalicibacterium sp.]|uniref:DUF3014 domain-containing protein n=1 Tax=uncultured Oxalicibacterium sp. TaxID=1168540 RepID=UPI0025E8BCDD|nr:DUF3014 domain-containing protein [uncultured Oxalicibacterium sp.]
MKSAFRFILPLILIVAAVAAYYLWSTRQAAPPPAIAVQEKTEPANTQENPPVPATPSLDEPKPIQHPLEPVTQAEPLLAVKDSDSLITPALKALIGTDLWRDLFYPEEIIRRIVTTIDNLPRSEASAKLWPVHPGGTWLETTGNDDNLIISPTNTARYDAYMTVVQNISISRLAALYRQYYPLFQRAYADLGYPDAYFNDRLVVAIDDLLATPEPIEAPRLVQKKVLYQFVDPDLEKRSAGQKIMLRIGVENAQIVKSKLRELRSAITSSAPDAGQTSLR